MGIGLASGFSSKAVSHGKRAHLRRPFVPATHTLPVLRQAAQKCRGCELYRNATQAVLGELDAPIAIAKWPPSSMTCARLSGSSARMAGGARRKVFDLCNAAHQAAGVRRRAHLGIVSK